MFATDDVQLAVLINSFNRLDLLRQAIGSLQGHLNLDALHPALLIFDAGSQDGSREFVQQLASQGPDGEAITLIDGRELAEHSFSAGVNCLAAAAIARYPNLRFMLLFETDNCLKEPHGPEPVARAVKILETLEDVAAVGFTVVKHDGQPTGFGCPFPTVAEFLAGQQIAAKLGLDRPRKTSQAIDATELMPSDVVFTSPLLMRVTAWQDVGGMDSKRFPFSDSDLDLCWRWHQAGWRLGVIQTDRVVHDNCGTISKWSEQRTLDFHEARLKLLTIHRALNFSLAYPVLLARHVAELACLAAASPVLASPARRLKVRWHLISRLHRRYRNVSGE